MLNEHFPEITLEESQLIGMEGSLKNEDKMVSSAQNGHLKHIREGKKVSPNNDNLDYPILIYIYFYVLILIIKSQDQSFSLCFFLLIHEQNFTKCYLCQPPIQ